MKMVLVFDTEDRQGMRDAYEMVTHLARQHMDLSCAKRVELTRFQLIKALQDFSRENLSDGKVTLPAALKFANAVLEKYGHGEPKED